MRPKSHTEVKDATDGTGADCIQRLCEATWLLRQLAIRRTWHRAELPPVTSDMSQRYVDLQLAAAPHGEVDELMYLANTDRDTMRVGDCFTIEPSLVQGSNSRGFQWDDGWTMATEVSCHLASSIRMS